MARFYPLLTLFQLLCLSLPAQQRQHAVQQSHWYPATEKSVFYNTGELYGFTKIQQQKMYAGMAAIVELIHQTQGVNPPAGFEAGVSATICENGCTGGQNMTGLSSILFRALFTGVSSSRIERDVEGPSIKVHFNDISRLLTRLPAGAEPYYVEREIVGSIQGFPVYAGGNFVAITKRKQPLFVPVTKEKVLQLEIERQEKELGKNKAAFRKTNLEWEPLLRNMPAKDSITKKEIVNNIAAQKNFVEKFEKELAALKKQLATMPAAEKKATALDYYGEKRLVIPNPDFFDPALPAHAIQLVIIDFNESTLQERGNSVYRQLFQKIKNNINLQKIWAALQ